MAPDGSKLFPGEDVQGLEDEDLYAVLGLPKDCSEGDLKTAYKKLALRWHPDRCSAKDSKTKFQAIQEAYSVLSDSNKRMMYDFGIYDDDDQIDGGEGQYGMCDFLGEMAAMMQNNKPSGNADQSFEELQELFLDMLDGGNDPAGPTAFEGYADGLFEDDGEGLFGAVDDDADDEVDFILQYSSPAASCSSSCSYFDQSLAGFKRGNVYCDPIDNASDIAAGFYDIFDSVAQGFADGPTASDSGSSTTKSDAAAADSGLGYGGRRVGTKQKVSSGVADGVPAAS